MVINEFEITNVTMLLHDLEELDYDLRRNPDEDLSLTGLLGVDDTVEAVSQDADANHLNKGTKKGPLIDRSYKKMIRLTSAEIFSGLTN